jgi:hypothetical protein
MKDRYERFLGQMFSPIRLVDFIAADEPVVDAYERCDFMFVRLCQLLNPCADPVGGTKKLFPGESFSLEPIMIHFRATYMGQMAVQDQLGLSQRCDGHMTLLKQLPEGFGPLISGS